MIDIQKFSADYLFHNFYNYLLGLKDTFLLQHELIYFIAGLFGLFVVLKIARKFFSIKSLLNEQSMLLELTPPSFTEQESYTTDQLFSIIHAIGNQQSFKERLLGFNTRFSLEIVSTKDQGIRYLVRTSPKYVNTFKRSLLSYLPHLKVNPVNEYLPKNTESLAKCFYKVIEFKLSQHYAFSLKRQSELEKHDPIAYITGMMTKLAPGELISLQVVLSPAKEKKTKNVSKLISANGDVVKYLKTPEFLKWLLFNNYKVPHTKTQSEMDVVKLIDTKINQPLFETSIRLLMIFNEKHDLTEREQGFKSSFSTFSLNGYQALISKKYLPINKVNDRRFYQEKAKSANVQNIREKYEAGACRTKNAFSVGVPVQIA